MMNFIFWQTAINSANLNHAMPVASLDPNDSLLPGLLISLVVTLIVAGLIWLAVFGKRAFCKHESLKWVCNIYGDSINHAGGMRSEWRCLKCDALILKPYLHTPEPIRNTLRQPRYDETHFEDK